MMDPMRSMSAALGALVAAVLIAACGSAATPAPAGSLGAVPASAAVTPSPSVGSRSPSPRPSATPKLVVPHDDPELEKLLPDKVDGVTLMKLSVGPVSSVGVSGAQAIKDAAKQIGDGSGNFGLAYAGDPKGTFNTFALRIPGASASNLLTSFAQMTLAETPGGKAESANARRPLARPRHRPDEPDRRRLVLRPRRHAVRRPGGIGDRGDEAARAAPPEVAGSGSAREERGRLRPGRGIECRPQRQRLAQEGPAAGHIATGQRDRAGVEQDAGVDDPGRPGSIGLGRRGVVPPEPVERPRDEVVAGVVGSRGERGAGRGERRLGRAAVVELEPDQLAVVHGPGERAQLARQADRGELVVGLGGRAARGQEVAEQRQRLGLRGDVRRPAQAGDRGVGPAVERVDPGEPDERREVRRAGPGAPPRSRRVRRRRRR